MPRSKNKKLAYKYFGPFKILKKVREMAYQLDLLEEAHIHSTFHVLLLKKWVGRVPFLNQGYQFFIPSKRLNPNLQRSLTKEAKMIEEVLLRWE
jgi:hypothetical protein